MDRLTGGASAGLFVFYAAGDAIPDALSDCIAGFTAGADIISLTSIDANTINGFDNDAYTLIGKQACSHFAGELRYLDDASANWIVV